MYQFGNQEIDAAKRVLRSGWLFRYLPEANEACSFEAELAAHLQVRRSLLVSSGTAALICALGALGIGPDDEVAIPAYGFVADALAVLAVGAVPLVCEIDDSLTLDPRDLEKKVGDRTRAVMPVHVKGLPCDMDRIVAVAERHGMAIVEDACQAIGGSYHGSCLGTIGQIGVFSFNQFKILTAGEGGALVTDRDDLYERAFIVHDGSCGLSPHRFEHPLFAGLAFRASEVTAAILRAQLGRLDHIIRRLRLSRDRLAQALHGVNGLHLAPRHDPGGECGTHLVYGCESEASAQLLAKLANDAGIDAVHQEGYWHAYPEWSILHERRGGHHRLRNPLRESARDFGPAACPRTTAVLATTVMLKCPLDIEEASIDAFRDSVAKRFG